MTHSPKQTGWEISEVRTVDGEFMVCGGEGHSFGLIATVTREEDARVMAAAPELYEKADAVMPILAMIEEGFWDDCPFPDVQKHRVAALRTALSKARPSNGGEA